MCVLVVFFLEKRTMAMKRNYFISNCKIVVVGVTPPGKQNLDT